MEIQESYPVPFKSAFEWRAGLFNIVNELTKESIIELISKYKESDQQLEWKDNDGLINFAFDEDLFAKINALTIEKAQKVLVGFSY